MGLLCQVVNSRSDANLHSLVYSRDYKGNYILKGDRFVFRIVITM